MVQGFFFMLYASIIPFMFHLSISFYFETFLWDVYIIYILCEPLILPVLITANDKTSYI